MKRIDEPELLDEDDAPRADMERSLRDLRRINKYLGGRSIYRRLLRVILSPAEGEGPVNRARGTSPADAGPVNRARGTSPAEGEGPVNRVRGTSSAEGEGPVNRAR